MPGRAVLLQMPDRNEAGISTQVIAWMRTPNDSLSCRPRIVVRPNIALHITKLSTNWRVICHHVSLALHHLPLRGDPGLCARPAIDLALGHLLRHLAEDVGHGPVRVRTVGRAAALVALMLVFLDGGHIAGISAGTVVDHYTRVWAHNSFVQQSFLDHLRGASPGHRRELAWHAGNDQISQAEQLKSHLGRHVIIWRFHSTSVEQDVFGSMAPLCFLRWQRNQMPQEAQEAVGRGHILSKFINVAGPIGGARCKGGTHRWRAGATTAAVLVLERVLGHIHITGTKVNAVSNRHVGLVKDVPGS
mmetsp:Transcript_5662/g.11958  ORF Transcript_5662/g.11958 Transcript_5662/m.11958 type:complete len:303 (-) Transcript_5662:1063-1971(-)